MLHSSRPIAPWTVYRFNFTMATSLLHRVTGIWLSLATWLGVLLWSESLPKPWVAYVLSWKHILVWFVAWSFSYHMLNGVRHLIWDKGFLMEPPTLMWTGLVVCIGSFPLAWAIVQYGVRL